MQTTQQVMGRWIDGLDASLRNSVVSYCGELEVRVNGWSIDWLIGHGGDSKFWLEQRRVIVAYFERINAVIWPSAGKKENMNPTFNLSGMKPGDEFFGCEKCGFQLDPKVAAAANQCPVCLGGLKIFKVTEDDMKGTK